MGLFSRRSKDSVRGTAQIVAASHYRGEGIYQNCRMQLVVTAEGMQPYSVEVHQIVPGKKWPQPGFTVPVTVSRSNPQNVKVDFGEVPSGKERARAMAEQQAAFLRGEGVPGGAGIPGALGASSVQFVGGSIGDVPPEKLAKLEQMLGMDLDGDGVIGVTAAAAAAAAAAADQATSSGNADRVGQLERLAQLHTSGALTDDEFAAEKRRILES
jgi:hypothetical protein